MTTAADVQLQENRGCDTGGRAQEQHRGAEPQGRSRRERQTAHDEMGLRIISYKILKELWPGSDHRLLR